MSKKDKSYKVTYNPRWWSRKPFAIVETSLKVQVWNHSLTCSRDEREYYDTTVVDRASSRELIAELLECWRINE